MYYYGLWTPSPTQGGFILIYTNNIYIILFERMTMNIVHLLKFVIM